MIIRYVAVRVHTDLQMFLNVLELMVHPVLLSVLVNIMFTLYAFHPSSGHTILLPTADDCDILYKFVNFSY